MNDPNRLLKWLMVIGIVVLSLVILYPPNQKLKGGIDLVGGTSLLFEIDTTGLEPAEQAGISTRVMRILKDRVDPNGQLNLEWRPVGNARLEIRMPRPPKEAIARREAYNQALDRVAAKNVSRFELESSLNSPEETRESAVLSLTRGVAEREPLLKELVTAYNAMRAAQVSGDTTAASEASATYEQAMTKVLATCLQPTRLADVLALPAGEKRIEELNRLRTAYPSYDASGAAAESKLISHAVQAYDLWSVNKADLEDPSDLKRRIKGAGVLEFRILADRNASSPDSTAVPVESISKYVDQLHQSGPRPRSGDRYEWFVIEDILRFAHVKNIEEFEAQRNLPGLPIIEEYAGRYYVLIHRDPEYSMVRSSQAGKRWSLRGAFPDRNPMTGENVVTFHLDPRGGQLFGELTGSNVNRQLCIMLDDMAMSHATINERITDRCQISGRFTPERVQDLVRTMEAGSLPARLKETPLSEQTIGPSLGESNRLKGIRAAVWGGALVAVFMLFYYGIVGGGVANVALMLNLLITLALMALLQATFTLPGIAGLVLTVGMAVDANVLIFERIREERNRGVIFKKALNLGYDKAFSTIFDANLTTLITCVILGFVGSEEVKGFAITLGLGLATSMFTALVVTRLIFNSLVAVGWLKDLRMMKIIGIPTVDWVGLRRVFWPLSCVVVLLGLTLFLGRSIAQTETIFDIEFLGGTSVQVDVKPGVVLSDDAIREAITAVTPAEGTSAVQWLNQAAEHLADADVNIGERVGEFVITSEVLTGDQIGVLMHATVEDRIERDGILPSGKSATLVSLPGALDLDGMRLAKTQGAQAARDAADRLRSARIQSVGEYDRETGAAPSYEIVTIETNRAVVQEAILAAIGEHLSVQQAISFTAVRDADGTREQYFVVESEDHYLSDVVGGDAQFDVRRFRGGAVVQVILDDAEEPLTIQEFQKRMREVGLQPEFEQYRLRDTTVFPLGSEMAGTGGAGGFRRFAVCAVDESLHYEDDPVRWADAVALGTLKQVEAALGSEKSLSKVVQFAPQIAGQTRNRALFAIVLSLMAIGAYVWLRFGNKEFGLATIVTLVHDVAVALGAMAISHVLYDTILGNALLLEDFRFDLPMVAALLTLIGYSLNDTIVVFDRIRENRGRTAALSASMINTSINQTLSRTILTTLTAMVVVVTLYLFGGSGVHGFSYVLIVGMISGTYSTLAIAVPLVYRPRVLYNTVAVIATLLLIGVIYAEVPNNTARLVLCGLVAVVGIAWLVRHNTGPRTTLAGAAA